jgi:hypothetical protein
MLSDSDCPDYGNGYEHEMNSSAPTFSIFMEAEGSRNLGSQTLSDADANTSAPSLYTTSWERYPGSNDGNLF